MSGFKQMFLHLSCKLIIVIIHSFKPSFMKKLVLLFTVCLPAFIFFNACKKSKPEEVVKSNLTMLTNSSDPLLVIAKSDDGGTVEFYGKRDGNGMPSKVDQIVIKKQADTTYYHLDQFNRPNKIITHTGIEFQLDWVADKHIALTVISNDGKTQINTEVKMMRHGYGDQIQTSKLQNYSRSGRKIKVGFTPDLQVDLSTPNGIQGINGTAEVNVTKCTAPSDATVFVNAYSTSGVLLGHFPSTRVSTGKYSYTMPDGIAPNINPKDACSKIADVLSMACTLNTPTLIATLCPALAAAIASSGIGGVVAGPIFAACEKIAAGLEMYCLVIDGSAAPGAPSLAERICAAELLDRDFKEDIVLRAGVLGIPNNFYGPSKTVLPNTPFPTLSIDLPGVTMIKTLKLTPAAPAPYVDFRASSEVSCLKQGSVVTISVVGTDGYTDHETFTITTFQSSGTFYLDVPGAAPGVRDDVTLKIKLPDGTTVTRTASLIYG